MISDLLANWADGLPPRDARTADWMFMGDVWQPVSIAGAYLLVVFLGPRLMTPFKAFELRMGLIIYNFFLTLLSLYMCIEFIMSVIDGGLNVGCSPVEYSSTPAAMRLANVSWVYYVSKLVEFLDTLVFILRKKREQISFLHVYHHVTMWMWWWLVTGRYAGGSVYFGAMMNSGVHVIMYFYYMLAAMGPAVRPYLWWKKYLTGIQMSQFLIVIGHNMWVSFSDCGFPKLLAVLMTAYMWTLFGLFAHFYRKSYRTPRKDTAAPAETISSAPRQGNAPAAAATTATKSNGLSNSTGIVQRR